MKAFLALAIIIVVAYVSWQLAYPTYTHHYRLTLEFQVDGRPVSGSSVYEVYARRQPKLLTDLGAISGFRGEATVVDLGRHGKLFAILASGRFGELASNHEYYALDAFKDLLPDTFERFQKIRTITGKREIQLRTPPTLVKFTDSNDPTTAFSSRLSDVSQFFEPEVSFLRATVEITNAQVTWQIDRHLPWIVEHERKGQGGTRIGYRDRFVASVPHFKRF